MTKERIQELNEELSDANRQAEIKEKNLRTELSKILEAGMRTKQYGDNEQIVYSWYEISAEIGKLIAKKKDSRFEEEVRLLAEKVYNLENGEEKI